jgi:glycosyltransferase involved in cell wall biosynthesis
MSVFVLLLIVTVFYQFQHPFFFAWWLPLTSKGTQSRVGSRRSEYEPFEDEKVKEHERICTFWLGRHRFSGSGLWVYLETVLPPLVDRLLAEGYSVRIIGAGSCELLHLLQKRLGEAAHRVQLTWLKNPLGNRYLGHLQDVFYLGRFPGIFHGLSNTKPIFGGGEYNLITLHDLFQAFPPSAPRGIFSILKSMWYRGIFYTLFSGTRLDAVVTDLQHTATEIRERYRAACGLHVLPPPLAAHFREPCTDEKAQDRTLKFLAFGSADPRKNFPRVATAFKSFDMSAELHVILANPRAEPLICEQLQTVGVNMKSVFIHVHPDNETLRELYRSVQATIFPSLAEGFGYPIYESLSQGTPVLTAQNLVSQEFADRCELLKTCDPRSVLQIESGMRELAEAEVSPLSRKEVISEVQEALSPEKYVRKLMECYFSVAKNLHLCECPEEARKGS